MEREEITTELAARLVAGQFPRWAGPAVTPVSLNGWDTTTFRLGDELTIRLPNGAGYAAAVAKKQRWLPILAGQLPLSIPEPVAMGRGLALDREPGLGCAAACCRRRSSQRRSPILCRDASLRCSDAVGARFGRVRRQVRFRSGDDQEPATSLRGSTP